MSTSPGIPAAGKPEAIGFIGLGSMGGPMVRHLASRGFPVVIYARNRAVAATAAADGARVVGSVKAVASAAKIVCVCLNSLDAAREVVFGADGLVHGDQIQTLVDFSTTGTDFAADMAARLEQRGILMLDAPISGSVVTAGNGRLGIMCSGPLRAFQHAEPMMRELGGAQLLYLGARNGNAQRLKGLNNLVSSTATAASSEAFVLGVKWGLAPESMLAVINAGDGSNNWTRNKFTKSVLPRTFDYGARCALTAKDTSNTIREAEDLGVTMWIGQTVRQLWHFVVSQGGAELDGTAYITFLEPWAGIEVRAGVNAATEAQTSSVKVEGSTVIACEERLLPAFAARLIERECTFVGLPEGAGADALLAALDKKGQPPRIVLNLCVMPTADSTILGRACATRGDVYLDAAHTGTARDIAEGRGAVIASANAALFEAVNPLLEAIADKVFHVSSKPGGAHLMRMIDQYLADTFLAVACESYVAGVKAGLDPLVMVKIIGIETGRTVASSHILPELVARRNFNHGKRIRDACDELSMLQLEARELGFTTWLLDKVRPLYDLAARLGSPEDDITRLATHYEKWAGIEIRAGSSDASTGTPATRSA